jgi:CRP-like cAMP-binding protein
LFFPEDEICRKRAVDDEMFFLSKGEVEVYIIDKFKATKFIQTLKPGNYFGEVFLLKN